MIEGKYLIEGTTSEKKRFLLNLEGSTEILQNLSLFLEYGKFCKNFCGLLS